MEEPTGQQVEQVIKEYPSRKASLLIPVLQKVQGTFGYVPPASLKLISRHTGVARSKIFGVLTFYAQFTTTPRGKYIIRPCRGTACHVKGAKNVLNRIKTKLGIEDGETTPDYKFTIETVACLGTCFLAPAMMVNNEYYGNLDEKKIEEILKEYQ